MADSDWRDFMNSLPTRVQPISDLYDPPELRPWMSLEHEPPSPWGVDVGAEYRDALERMRSSLGGAVGDATSGMTYRDGDGTWRASRAERVSDDDSPAP